MAQRPASRDGHDDSGTPHRRVGPRTAETWWAVPVQGCAAALMVAAPAVGVPWALLIVIASSWMLLAAGRFVRARSGLTTTRPSGPRSVALLIALIVVLVAAVGGSVALVLQEHQQWVVPLALTVGVIVSLGAVVYDRVDDAERRRP